MSTDRARKLSCPKCEGPMHRVQFDTVEVDRCSRCGGIWFDASEMDALRTVLGADSIDTGDPRVGAALDAQRGVTCPICSVPMQRSADALTPHVWYERCHSCGGVFLDAGEFRELRSDDVFNLFRRLLDER